MPSTRPLLTTLLAVVLLAACADRGEQTTAPAETPATGAGETPPTFPAAIAKLNAGDPAGAAAVLEKLVEHEPKNARAWSFLGQVRSTLELPAEAAEAYLQALEVNPEQYGASYGLATLQARQGQIDQALARLAELRRSGGYDLSQITLDANFAELHDDARFQELLMKPEEFDDPFVEPVRVIHEWRGETANDQFGWVARNVGDVDGDGVDDVVTSAPTKNVEGAAAGRIYVYSGKSGKELWRADGKPGDQLGLSVDAAGDVDGDGRPDVVASASGGDRVRIYRGHDGKPILELEAAQTGEGFGNGVIGVGDVDGDGHGELLVGAPQNDAAGQDAGRAGLYSGKDGSLLHEWRGEQAGDHLGSMVAGEQNLLILGAPNAGEGDRGRVYVYGGAEDQPRFVIDSDPQGSQLGSMFLSVVGDVDGDGTDDVYASDWAHGAAGSTVGKIVVHSGADGRELLALGGEAAGDGFGIGPADAGDVDGDGHADLVVGAWQQAAGAPRGGKVYVYSGKDGRELRAITSKVMGDTFGFDATGLGDVDGDGKIDYLLTSAWSAVSGARSGRVFVIAGE